jgi:hypothetical protein
MGKARPSVFTHVATSCRGTACGEYCEVAGFAGVKLDLKTGPNCRFSFFCLFRRVLAHKGRARAPIYRAKAARAGPA